jgi:hypothetical protein
MDICWPVHALVPQAYVSPPPPIPAQQVSPAAQSLVPQGTPVVGQPAPTQDAQRCVVVSHDRPDGQSPSATH